jgi:CheY-like chemotaxis protein
VKPVSREDILSALTRVGALPETSRTLLAIDDDPLAVELVRAALQPEAWIVLSAERNLKLVRDVLRFAGYDVIEARSGEQGVALATERCPDLVLMDLQLPAWTVPRRSGCCARTRLRERFPSWR